MNVNDNRGGGIIGKISYSFVYVEVIRWDDLFFDDLFGPSEPQSYDKQVIIQKIQDMRVNLDAHFPDLSSRQRQLKMIELGQWMMALRRKKQWYEYPFELQIFIAEHCKPAQ